MRFMILVILLVSTLTAPAGAQSGGGSATRLPEDVIRSTGPISAAGKKAIKGFVDQWVTKLADESTTTVRGARVELLRPLATPGATEVFRLEYSNDLVPRLEPMLRQGGLFQATNAIAILKALDTEGAIGVLQVQSSQKSQPKVQIRIAAAGAMADSATSITLTQAKADPLSRAIRESCSTETEWIVVYGNLATLAAFSSNPHLPTGSQDEAFKAMIAALDTVTQRAAKGGSSAPLMQAVWRALGSLRDHVTHTQTAKLSGISEQVRALLPNVVSAAKNIPAAAAPVRASFEGAREIALTLMSFLPSPTKFAPGEDGIKAAWAAAKSKVSPRADTRPAPGSTASR